MKPGVGFVLLSLLLLNFAGAALAAPDYGN
jgi:hypothetical protein